MIVVTAEITEQWLEGFERARGGRAAANHRAFVNGFFTETTRRCSVELDEEKLPPARAGSDPQNERMILLDQAREWFQREFPGCTIGSVVLHQPDNGRELMDGLSRRHDEYLKPPPPSLMLETKHLLD